MLKPILLSIEYSWEIKSHCIDLLSMMVPGVVDEQNDDHIDFSSFIPSLFTTLQVPYNTASGAYACPYLLFIHQ